MWNVSLIVRMGVLFIEPLEMESFATRYKCACIFIVDDAERRKKARRGAAIEALESASELFQRVTSLRDNTYKRNNIQCIKRKLIRNG